jgi:hypothetical protein
MIKRKHGSQENQNDKGQNTKFRRDIGDGRNENKNKMME